MKLNEKNYSRLIKTRDFAYITISVLFLIIMTYLSFGDINEMIIGLTLMAVIGGIGGVSFLFYQFGSCMRKKDDKKFHIETKKMFIRMRDNISLFITAFCMIFMAYFLLGGSSMTIYWILLTVISILVVLPYIIVKILKS